LGMAAVYPAAKNPPLPSLRSPAPIAHGTQTVVLEGIPMAR
jgi:hypothetical protein